MNLVIFGAQGYALGAYEAMKTLYPKKNIPFFMVSKLGMNANTLGGLPVREIASVSKEMTAKEKDFTEVVIATPENVQPEIEEILENYGFHYYSRLDSDRWGELMKLFHVRIGRFFPLSAMPPGCNCPFIRYYIAKSHKDVPLKMQQLLPDYIFPLQAGAAKTECKVAELADDKGQNISMKNGNYSEITGLYWIWKNKLCADGMRGEDKSQYFGLGQYRRLLVFSDDDLRKLCDNDVDAVLPYPMPYEPNIHAHHERYLKESDWNVLLEALEQLQPEYAKYFPKILKQQYFYNYNVILARKKVLREYCEWLFPILERVEELSVPKGKDRNDRYIGYMAETLETLYFMKNTDRLNIAHTHCKLYV